MEICYIGEPRVCHATGVEKKFNEHKVQHTSHYLNSEAALPFSISKTQKINAL